MFLLECKKLRFSCTIDTLFYHHLWPQPGRRVLAVIANILVFRFNQAPEQRSGKTRAFSTYARGVAERAPLSTIAVPSVYSHEIPVRLCRCVPDELTVRNGGAPEDRSCQSCTDNCPIRLAFTSKHLPSSL